MTAHVRFPLLLPTPFFTTPTYDRADEVPLLIHATTSTPHSEQPTVPLRVLHDP